MSAINLVEVYKIVNSFFNYFEGNFLIAKNSSFEIWGLPSVARSIRSKQGHVIINEAAFDSRGNGQMIAEKLSLEFPGFCDQVMISSGWYARVMPQVKSLLEEKGCLIPSDDYLFSDFSTVQLVNGIAKITERIREGTTGTARHGDGAVAFALCVDALLEEGQSAAPYVAETHPSDASMFKGY